MNIGAPSFRAVLLGAILIFLTAATVAKSEGRRAQAGQKAQANPATATTTATPAAQSPSTDKADPLVAQGKKRYEGYKCYDCHGHEGEGTDDAPDLTHSHLTADQVSKFLEKPSVDAKDKGMPDIPVDSPDHKPLVAFIMSLRKK